MLLLLPTEKVGFICSFQISSGDDLFERNIQIKKILARMFTQIQVEVHIFIWRYVLQPRGMLIQCRHICVIIRLRRFYSDLNATRLYCVLINLMMFRHSHGHTIRNSFKDT